MLLLKQKGNQWDKSLKNILDVKVKNYFSYSVGFSHLIVIAAFADMVAGTF